mgnify:CR=1 FL=1
MSWLHCAFAVLGQFNQIAKPGSTAHHSLSCCFPLSSGHACGRATVGRHVAHAVAHAVARLLAQPVRGPSSCHTSSRFSSSWLACVLSSVTKGTGYLACHSPHQNQRLGGTRPTQAPGYPSPQSPVSLMRSGSPRSSVLQNCPLLPTVCPAASEGQTTLTCVIKAAPTGA